MVCIARLSTHTHSNTFLDSARILYVSAWRLKWVENTRPINIQSYVWLYRSCINTQLTEIVSHTLTKIRIFFIIYLFTFMICSICHRISVDLKLWIELVSDKINNAYKLSYAMRRKKWANVNQIIISIRNGEHLASYNNIICIRYEYITYSLTQFGIQYIRIFNTYSAVWVCVCVALIAPFQIL